VDRKLGSPTEGQLSVQFCRSHRTHGQPGWETTGNILPVETTIDSVGRIVVPKQLRDSLGMQPGTTVDVTAYGAGLQVLPAGRTARIVQVDGHTVAESDTPITDDVIFGLIDSARR
jgi:AbrB family looped-hinge helix DNA binding protein